MTDAAEKIITYLLNKKKDVTDFNSEAWQRLAYIVGTLIPTNCCN